MPTDTYPLESYFRQTVRASFAENVGLNDHEIIDYVTRVLCEFSEPDSLYRLKNTAGQLIVSIPEMLRAADPVFGTAASFDEERSVRRYIGDFALYLVGMQLDVIESAPNFHADRAIVEDLIRLGKQSYETVSRFDMFEYEDEAPLFARIAESFDRCILGIALVRDALNERRLLDTPQR